MKKAIYFIRLTSMHICSVGLKDGTVLINLNYKKIENAISEKESISI